MKTFIQLNETSNALRLFNHHKAKIREHEQGIKDTEASMRKFPGKDKVQKYGAAQIEYHRKEIEKHHAEKRKHEWVLKHL